jgi:hypothetical protein
MPRRIASLYMKLRGRGSYRTYTYTRHGYEKLLKEAGFTDVTVYAALPDYRFPRVICDIDEVRGFAAHRYARALPSSIVGAFVDSFFIVAKRQ